MSNTVKWSIGVLAVCLIALGQGSHATAGSKAKQLTDLSCTAGQTVAFDGAEWVCADFPAGATGLQRIQVNSDSSLDAVATKEVTATCPVGKKVVGGGHLLSFFGGATNVPLRNSVPTIDLRSWTVSGTNFDNTPWGLTAIAICAEVDD